MNYKIKIFILIVSLSFIFAIKNYYGGTMKIRLNEPSDFSISSTSYSDMVFYSLIYENLFYLTKDGNLYSNIFNDYKYEKAKKQLVLNLKYGIKYSNGSNITPNDIIRSIGNFLETGYSEAKKLNKIIKKLGEDNGKVLISLNFDYPNITELLSAPQLVIMSENHSIFSGPFKPVKWLKNKYMLLEGNRYYVGGLPYIDKIRVDFENYYYPDLFLSKPGTDTGGKHREYNSGVYQNYYISFPKGKIGENTRIAFYTILKNFFKEQNYPELNVLTSESESPLSINIKKFSTRRVKRILRYTNIKLYLISTLRDMEDDLIEYFKKYRVNISVVFLKNNMSTLMNETKVNYFIIEKVFHGGLPLYEKIKKIVRETIFKRFNENYLNMIQQLDELINLKDNDLLMEQISGIIQKIIGDGYLLPLAQKKYSIYLKKNIKGIIIDYYGRPIVYKGRYELPIKEIENAF